MINDDFDLSTDSVKKNNVTTNENTGMTPALPEIGYDDPRVRSFMDNENLSAEDAIRKVQTEQSSSYGENR